MILSSVTKSTPILQTTRSTSTIDDHTHQLQPSPITGEPLSLRENFIVNLQILSYKP
jgi:hypothetical protein